MSVIPKTFWAGIGLSKPSTLTVLCPEHLEEDSSYILLVVLWSRCNPDFSREIKECLELGSRRWKTDESFRQIEWLKAYILCIRTSVYYARRQILLWLENDNSGHPNFRESPNLLDAFALSQALSSSTEWFRILTTEDEFWTAFNQFYAYLQNEQPRAKFLAPVNLTAFSRSDSVTHVSVASWFKHQLICPNLREIMNSIPMKNLMKGITSVLLNRGMTFEQQQEACGKFASKACTSLGIHPHEEDDTAPARLLAFALIADEILTNIGHSHRVLSEEDAFRILGPMLCDARDDVTFSLKGLMEQQPPVLPHEFVCAVVTHGLSSREERLSAKRRKSPRGSRQEREGGEVNSARKAASPARKRLFEQTQGGTDETEHHERQQAKTGASTPAKLQTKETKTGGALEVREASKKTKLPPVKRRRKESYPTQEGADAIEHNKTSAKSQRKERKTIGTLKGKDKRKKDRGDIQKKERQGGHFEHNKTPAKIHTKESKAGGTLKVRAASEPHPNKTNPASVKKHKEEASTPSKKRAKEAKESECVAGASELRSKTPTPATAKTNTKQKGGGLETVGTAGGKSKRASNASKSQAKRGTTPDAFVLFCKARRKKLAKSNPELKDKELVSFI